MPGRGPPPSCACTEHDPAVGGPQERTDRITDPSGRVTPLLDWHKGDALKTEAEMLFASGSAMIAGAASPTMGIVLADDDKAGDEPS